MTILYTPTNNQFRNIMGDIFNPVGIDSAEIIQPSLSNGDFSAITLGSELITDPSFDTACGVNWVCTAPWTIAGGVASIDGSQGGAVTVQENGVLPASRSFYRTEYTLSLSAGGAWILVGNSTGTLQLSSGTYTEYRQNPGIQTYAGVRSTATLVGTVDDVSFKQITIDDWTAGDSWGSYNDGKATVTGAQSAESILEQDVGCVAGQTYRVTGVVSSYTAGNLTPNIGGQDGSAISANGAFSQDIVASTTGNLQFKADATCNLKLDDITVAAIA